MSRPPRCVLFCLALFGLFFAGLPLPGAQATWAQTPPPLAPTCDGLRALMAAEATPHADSAAGSVLSAGVPATVALTAEQYAAYHLLNIIRADNQASGAVAVGFSEVTAEAGLEATLYRGLEAVGGGYRPVRGGTTLDFTVAQSGLYTLVVRRAAIITQPAPLRYTVTAAFPDRGPAVLPASRDDTTGANLTPERAPNGLARLEVSGVTFTLPAESAPNVATRDGRSAQIRYGENGLLVGDWAEEVALLAGDLAVRGSVEVEGGRRPRLLYIQDFAHAVNLTDPELTSLTDAAGATLGVDWATVRGLWLLRDCAGVRLHDGRTFVAALRTASAPPVTGFVRSARFTGPLDDFEVRLRAQDVLGLQAVDFALDLSWSGVAAGSEMTLADGRLYAVFTGDNDLAVADTTISLFPRPGSGDDAEAAPLDVALGGRGITLALDWRSVDSLTLVDDTLGVRFNDARGEVRRDAGRLLRFEVLDGAARLIDKPTPDGVAGEHRLWLGADGGYFEIITPAGLPDFDARALPGQPGYFPRALNNLGGECYPVNTLLPEANCPPNGHVNPANGNLWYAVTDLRAAGGWIDLALTRSYNLLAREQDGPFGRGWATAFALDYRVAYDEATRSRPVTREATTRVGLDLTWEPRGLVTFTTPSGSRHTFVSASAEFADGVAYGGQAGDGPLTALTMPGWTLTRDDAADADWTLRQSDGLTYVFDRAGRLRSYGYPALERVVRIAYDYAAPRSFTAGDAVVITDDLARRRLELIYDSEGRVARALLRDLTGRDPATIPPGATCALTENCEESRYSYTPDGLLAAVEYADGARANYSYDAEGRLTEHADPRAPISPAMRYRYAPDGTMEAIHIVADAADADTPWRRFSLEIAEGERRFSVTEPFASSAPGSPAAPAGAPTGRTTVYTYALAAPPPASAQPGATLRTRGAGFTLIAVRSPLAGIAGGVDGEAQGYTWEDGLLRRINARGPNETLGRNSITIGYAPDGAVNDFGLGVNAFTVREYDARGLPARVDYGDLSVVRYAYDDAGRVTGVTDRQGARYAIQWDDAGRPSGWRRDNDGVTWTTTTDSLGLVTEENRGGHRVRYAYDGLGRVVEIVDALLGRYRVAYAPGEITITDAGGVAELRRYDVRGRLVELRITEPGDPRGDPPRVLRHAAWAYDLLDRMVSERVWAGDDDQPLATTITYDDSVAVLAAPPGETAAEPALILGRAVTVRAPDGRSTRTTYDALGRVREVLRDGVERQRFTYTYDEVEVTFGGNTTALRKGLRVEGRDYLGESWYARTQYQFNERWALREVTRTTYPAGPEADRVTQRWSLATQGEPVVRQSYTELEAPGVGIARLNWAVGAGDPRSPDARPTGATITASPLGLVSGAAQPGGSRRAPPDFLGRPASIQDGDGPERAIIYCPQGDGGQRIYVLNGPDRTGAACDSRSDFQQQLSYDAHGRLTEVVERTGDSRLLRRTVAYQRDGAQWAVTVNFGSGGAASAWTLRYDAVGNLRAWLDADGILRQYDYDSAGRLIAVSVAEAPDASYTLAYDPDTGLLERVADGLGRGWLYQYDERGLLLARQRIETADATTFAYDGVGRLTSVISPLGSTVIYRYGDAHDPRRITEIVDATGVVHRYTWDDRANTLTYSDVRGRITRYHYDALGALWMIGEGDGAGVARTTELRYDAAGALAALATGVRAGDSAAQTFTLTPGDAPGSPLVIAERGVPDWAWGLRFEAGGALTAITDPRGHALNFSYDALGRLTRAEAGSHIWSLTHVPGEAVLNIAQSETNQPAAASALSFDALYRLTALTDPATGAGTRYVYSVDENFNLTIIERDEAGATTTRTYTFFPGDNTATPPSVTLTARGLNAAGDGVEAGAPTGQALAAIYNPEGRIEELRHIVCMAQSPQTECLLDEAETPTFTAFARLLYDAEGRPIRINDAESGLEVFTYDDVGRLSAYQTVNGRAFTYQYDALDRLSSITGPTGIRVLLAYNDLDLVVGACRARAEAVARFAECEALASSDDAAARASVSIERYTYDSLGRLTGTRFANADEGEATDAVIARTYQGGLLTAWGAPEGANGTRTYSDDALALLETVDYGGESVALDYRLSPFGQPMLTAETYAGGAPDHDYAYDALGRLAGLGVGELAFALDYAADRRGYAFSRAPVGDEDGITEPGIRFALDARGLLTGLSVADAVPALDFSYAGVQGATTILQLNIDEPGASQNFIYEFDRVGETRNQAAFFFASDADGDDPGAPLLSLVNAYRLDLAGQVNRQQLDGEPAEALFAPGSGGYIVVTGYNDNFRLTTVSVTSRLGGTPLYTMNLAYNAAGQREGETRRYGDGGQLDLRYQYAPSNQLIAQTFDLFRAPRDEAQETATNGWPLLALPALLWLGWRRRGARQIGVIFSLALGLLLGTLALAQNGDRRDGRETVTFGYEYDAAGNLARILLTAPPDADDAPVECAAFAYDAANRLTEARLPGVTTTYAYDLGHRLTRVRRTPIRADDSADDWTLVYAGEQPLAAVDAAGETRYFGRLDEMPPLFMTGDSGVDEAGEAAARLTWLLGDGRDRLLGAVADATLARLGAQPAQTGENGAAAFDALQLRDPLGRAITFALPNAGPAREACGLLLGAARAEAGPTLDLPLVALDGMIWDPATDLYFDAGRAYLPGLGRYLSRRAEGIDAYGSVYELTRRPDIPAQRQLHPPAMTHLLRLQAAVQTVSQAEHLTPDAALATYGPAFDFGAPEIGPRALAARAPQAEVLARLQALPARLRDAYNLPEPSLDPLTGMIRLDLTAAPGQGRAETALDDPFVPDGAAAFARFSPAVGLEALWPGAALRVGRPNSYDSLRWLPTVGTVSSPLAGGELPALIDAVNPSAVLAWLPRGLNALSEGQAGGADVMARNMDALRALEAIRALPFQTGADWLAEALKAALPTQPDLPPLDVEGLLAAGFDNDTFGLARALRTPGRMPAAPDVPVYSLFPTLDWLRGPLPTAP